MDFICAVPIDALRGHQRSSPSVNTSKALGLTGPDADALADRRDGRGV
jgi:hypothetical protein